MPDGAAAHRQMLRGMDDDKGISPPGGLEEGKMDEKSVNEIIEEVKTEICDNYCKYPDIYDTRKDSGEDYDYDRMFGEKCDRCPLNRL